MGFFRGPDIVRDGLVLNLDAKSTRSYPGTGSTWYDLSPNGKHFTFGAGITWNSAGYFTNDGSGVFTGPASNTFGFYPSNENYVEVYAQVLSATGNVFFDFQATSSAGGDNRAIFSHFYYSNGNTYYDIGGCCGSTQRISYANDSDLTAGVRHFSWRTRTNATPNREMFKNLVSQVSSGTESTATSTWNLNTTAKIANGWNGRLYVFRMYNRALTDAEMLKNFNATRKRFGI